MGLERLARGLGVAGRLHFLGRRNDVPALLKACDLYLHCSPEESFGLAVLEALAAGLPVVANDLPAFRSWTDGSVLLVERRPEAYAEAIKRVMSDADLRRRLAGQGSAVARSFDVERTADAYASLYADPQWHPAAARASGSFPQHHSHL